MNKCECGCGEEVNNRFAWGHNARRMAARNNKTARNREIVQRLEAGETYTAVAQAYDVSKQRVEQIARANGIPPRGPATGPDHGNWKGGRRRQASGYVKALAPDHPRANESGLVFEHILIAEEKIGRPLRGNECVHHINGDKADNRPENLAVLTPAEHIRIHRQKHTPELLIDCFRWLALKLGRTPTNADVPEHLGIAHTSYYRHVGSMSATARRAGLRPNGVGTPGHGGEPLPRGFREAYGHLTQYDTPEELADDLYGGWLTEHERAQQEAAEKAA